MASGLSDHSWAVNCQGRAGASYFYFSTKCMRMEYGHRMGRDGEDPPSTLAPVRFWITGKPALVAGFFMRGRMAVVDTQRHDVLLPGAL